MATLQPYLGGSILSDDDPPGPGGNAIHDTLKTLLKRTAGNGMVRYADDYTDADYGDKVLAAADDLGSRGGVILMRPTAVTEYSSVIDLSAAEGIHLMGVQVPSIQAGTTFQGGTYLKYTGDDYGIKMGDPDAKRRSLKLEGFTLELTSAATGGILLSGNVYGLRMNDINVEGSGSGDGAIGINLNKGDPSTSQQSVAYGIKARHCATGIRLNGCNASNWYGCEADNCVTGWHLTGQAVHTLISGGTNQLSTSEQMLFEDCTTPVVLGVYFETSADAGSLVATLGANGTFARYPTFLNCYLNANGASQYAFEINYCMALSVLGGHYRDSVVALIDNNHSLSASNKNHRILPQSMVNIPVVAANMTGILETIGGVDSAATTQVPLRPSTPPPISIGLTEADDAYDIEATDTGTTYYTTLATSGTLNVNLPAATVGLSYQFRLKAAERLQIEPDGTETIALPSTGTQGAADKYLWADAVGEWIKLHCEADGEWECGGSSGTWTAEA